MTTQPLTPQSTHVVFVGSDIAIDDALRAYGIPTDAGNVEPTLTVTRLRTYAEVTAFIATVPSPLLPWAVCRTDLPDIINIASRLTSYFGQAQTVASAMAALNNEYAIHPSRLRG